MTIFLISLIYTSYKGVDGMLVRKGAKIMTNVLTNADNIIGTYEEKKSNESKEISKSELFLLYLKIRDVINDEEAQQLMKEYIIKDKTINSGRATIKGTRVTPEDIGRILLKKENMEVKDIMEEYPSLENEEQVLAGLMYYVRKNVSFINILFAK